MSNTDSANPPDADRAQAATQEPETIAENGFVYLGVAATEPEEKSMQAAFRVPLMVIGSYLPTSPHEVVHACALRHGLPDIVGFYGYDFGKHEFVRMPGATHGEPDKWPSRKLSDVLAAAGMS